MRFNKSLKTEESVKLDLKDRKILHWLSQNARLPYTKIAGKVGLSKDAVKYRVKNLEKAGVIQGYVAAVNISKLGFDTYHLLLQLNHPSKEIRENTIAILKSYPFVKVIIELSGKYNFEVGIVSKTTEELDERITKIVSDLSKYLQDFQILTVSKYYESRAFPKSFFESKVEFYSKRFEQKVQLDKTDSGILKLLSDDASLTLIEISKTLRLSPDTINYRMKKLFNAGIILRYAPVVNYSALGYTVYIIPMNLQNLDQEREKILKNFLKGNKNILWAVKTIGKYNLLTYACVKNSEELHDTLIKMRELFGSAIKDYETFIAYEEHAYTYFPKVCWENLV